MSTAHPAPAAKNIFTAEFLADPYPVYASLCAEGPIHRIQLGVPRWILVRYAECFTFLRDPRLSSMGRARVYLSALPDDARGQFAELQRALDRWMLFLDAPEHSRLRKLLNKGFAPPVVQALRGQIEAMVDEMLDSEALVASKEIDLVGDFAYPLPVRVIAQMLGVPSTRHREFTEWTNSIALFFGSPLTNASAQRTQESVIGLTSFFRNVVMERRLHRGTDLVSLLIDIEEEGHTLTDDELYAQCVLLLFAGHETTRNLIASGMYTLLRNAEAMSDLRVHPEIVRTAVEELLRYESPLQYVSRVAKEDTKIADTNIPAGESVLFLLAAANRDPRKFEDPDHLNLRRVKNDHLAFGAGAHFCIGNLLARLEAQVAILKLLQRFPNMRLTDKTPEWAPNFAIRGLKSLKVAV
jgi:cytochrome P450